MTIMAPLFASLFCSPSPPPLSRRWHVMSARLSRTRFNSPKPFKTKVLRRRKASSSHRQSSDAGADARYIDRPDLTITIKSP
jgi:hypothetical protein